MAKFVEKYTDLMLKGKLSMPDLMDSNEPADIIGVLADGRLVKTNSSSSGGISSVSGELVDNSDPQNPIINNPDIGDIEGFQDSIDELQDSIDGKADLVHSHIISDVNNLQTELDSKQPVGDYATNTDLDNGLNTKADVNHTHIMSDITGLGDALNNKVDKIEGQGLSPEPFTADEKAKLAGLDSGNFQGQFLSYADLESANLGGVGHFAYVDEGLGNAVELYIWNDTNSLFEVVAGEPTAETPASIKSKYESNADTNPFTDAEQTKLANMVGGITSAIKTGYDNAVSWITANGANLLAHLTNFNNPHNVNASQVGLGNVDNTSDADKPASTLVQSTLTDLSNNKQDKLIEGSGISIVDNVISATGGSSGGEILTAKILINPERLKDLRYNPLELIPNPGVNKIINVYSLTAFLDFNTTRYNFPVTNPSVTISVRYMRPDGSFPLLNSGNFSNGIARLDPVINHNERRISKLTPINSGNITDVQADNCSVVIHSQGANSTVGDSDLTVIINYVIDDFN